jgi:uncharacterized membrane protein YjjP (DUF1212 family)
VTALVLSLARVLFVNGQTSDQTVAAAEEVAASLGLRAPLIPRWGQLQFAGAEVAADPSGVDMDRVASAMRVAEQLRSGRLSPAGGIEALEAIDHAAPAPTWLFALAAGAGAVALAVIFGLEHLAAAAIVFVSAAVGAVVRRLIARYTANVFLQPFCAALLAGAVGALAVRYQLSSSLRLIAVCPCMILVPGPHVLNGALDLIRARIHLGAARLVYAGLVVLSISAGLLLGLTLLGASLPAGAPGRSVPFWEDIIAAGVAVFAYSVFFSTPLRMLPWPVATGMLAHGARWLALTSFGFSVAGGAALACFIAGIILTPPARRTHMPFAAIGFAAVVSLMPGVYLFRLTSGLLQLATGSPAPAGLADVTLGDAVTAAEVIIAMSLGLIIPKLIIDRISDRTAPATR